MANYPRIFLALAFISVMNCSALEESHEISDVIYGVPAGYNCGKNAEDKGAYIIPVEQIPGEQLKPVRFVENAQKGGLLPLNQFKMHLVPLQRYLQNHSLPPYMKFSLVDPKREC